MIAVTFFSDKHAANKRTERLSVAALAERIRTTTQPTKDRLPWLKLASFGDTKSEKNSLRHDANVLAVNGIEADYDGEQLAMEDAERRLTSAGISAIVYTSPSHCEDAPRWRVLCPFAGEHPPAERDRYMARLSGLFGGIFARESWTLSQSYYFGSVRNNPSHRVAVIEGVCIDLADELDADAIGRPEKPKPNGDGAHITPSQHISDNRIGGLVEALLDNVRRATDGNKHHTLRDNARTLGGYLHLIGWSTKEAVDQLVAALPASVIDWDGARGTAEWGITEGRRSPLDLADRPQSRMRDLGGTTTDKATTPEVTAKSRTDGTVTGTLALHFGFEATFAQSTGTIVEGLLHAGSVTLIYGPPKSGKSFLVTDLSLVIAAGLDCWMGQKIIRPGSVLYVACEGHAGFWKRLAAAAQTRGWDEKTFPSNFILATGRPMLIKVDAHGMHYAPDPSSILTALADAKAKNLNPVAIVIDTVFRSFGAGNVNASQDMNVYLAAVAVLTDWGYAVALVHHEIKAGGTPAGSVSLIGGTDNIAHVWRENDTGERRFWQVEMAKDDAETEPRAFSLKVVPIGLDPDGRPVSSCVVIDGGPAPEQAQRKRGRPAGNGAEGVLADLIYRELCNLLADPREGQDIIFHPELPSIRAVSRGKLRISINQAGILETPDGAADAGKVESRNRVKVHRALNLLKKRQKIVMNEQSVGLPAGRIA